MITRKGKILSWCPDCRRTVEAALTLSYDDARMLMEDFSACGCGKVLWDWKWMPGAAKAVETKAAVQMRLF